MHDDAIQTVNDATPQQMGKLLNAVTEDVDAAEAKLAAFLPRHWTFAISETRTRLPSPGRTSRLYSVAIYAGTPGTVPTPPSFTAIGCDLDACVAEASKQAINAAIRGEVSLAAVEGVAA